ncbi:MAG: UDP-N-acetylmuramoyl-L-alanine--D-glutamate ligase [Candidatus Zixiibacteriota bacterium]
MRFDNFSYVENTMTVEERIKDRRISIVGMARSGVAAALLADHFSGIPFVSDVKKPALLTAQIKQLKDMKIPFETNGHTERLLQCDYMIVSPGVPLSIDIIIKAREKGIPVFSEIEFASWVCKGKIIAVTGSNGKTTTTSLLGELFTAGGYDTYIGGNIGLPFSEFALKVPSNGVAIIEVSNFQLETIADFSPDTALILNLTPDHLDRYDSFDDYKKAKYRITENQTVQQSLILNYDDSEITGDTISTKAQVYYFTTTDSSQTHTFVRDEKLYCRKKNQEVAVINCSEILIPGPHNLQNAVAAASAAILYGIPPETIRKVLHAFPGVEHRMENAGKVAGISFINDSKATNVDSVCFALRSVDTKLYLIAGGRDKGADFTPIIQYGKNKIKGVIAIGEAKEKIINTFGQAFPVQFADSLEDAVKKMFETAIPGETILLSPGCASFDMFENFEHRGKVFKEAVANLRKGKNENEALSKK